MSAKTQSGAVIIFRKLGFGFLACGVVFAALELGLRAAGRGLALHTWGGMESGDVRVLCVGDSNTYGIGTTPAVYSWPRQLEVAMQTQNPDISVVVYNRGLPGMSSTDILRFLPAYLEETRPRVVCMQVGANNTWNLRGASVNTTGSVGPAGKWLRYSQVYRAMTIVIGRLQSGHRVSPSRFPAWPRTPDQSPAEIQIGQVRTDFSAGLDRLEVDGAEIARLCDDAGASLVLVTYPNMFSASERMRKTAANHGLVLLDVAPSFRDAPASSDRWWESGLISADGSHPNRHGYALIARDVFRGLVPVLNAQGVIIKGPGNDEIGATESEGFSDAEESFKKLHQDASLMETTIAALALADAGRTTEAIERLESRLQGHGELLESVEARVRQAGPVGPRLDGGHRLPMVQRKNLAHRVLGDDGAWMAAETLFNLKASLGDSSIGIDEP